MKIYSDWAELVTDPEWSTYISANHIPLEFVERLWEEAQKSLLTTKSCKEITETFTDPRDGKTYKTVKIGDKIWMAENLAYEGVEHDYPMCNEAYVEKYGCLYTWENAKRACPPGWRLPTKDEFDELVSTYDASKDSSSLRDPSWKNGLNSSGFGVLPVGGRWCNGKFYDFETLANFWSATPYEDDRVYDLHVGSDSADVGCNGRINAFSVRCVKDTQ